MQYLQTFYKAFISGLIDHDAAWWGRMFAGSIFFAIGVDVLGLNFTQSTGVLLILIAANIWRE